MAGDGNHVTENPPDNSKENSRIAEIEKLRQTIQEGGGVERVSAQHAKGKRTARERIDAFVDQGSFWEMDASMTHRHHEFGLESQRYPGDGVICGYGKITGRMVCLCAQDFTVLGGSFSEVHGQKISRMMDLAMENGLPVVFLNDSGGARIQEGIYSLNGYGELFWRNSQASGVVPQISVILGPCAGGAVYSPALTDFIVMTKRISQMFITGPEVIKAVTGEEVDFETLGGGITHTSLSGVASFLAEDEEHAVRIVKRLLSYLPANNTETPAIIDTTDSPWRMDEALSTIVPENASEPYDVKEILRRVVDLGTFFETGENFAQNAVTGFGRLHGASVGLIASQPLVYAGVIDIDAADKIARFVRFCDAFNIPLITFVDTPGFMPGVNQEHGGIIRHGAKMVYAYSEATVPKISVVLRKAYGGAYLALCSKSLHADLAFAWPTAEIAVMGAEGAINILYRKQLQTQENSIELREQLIETYREKFGSPFPAAQGGFVNDILLPKETRPRLIASLELLRDKHVTRRWRKHDSMPM